MSINRIGSDLVRPPGPNGPTRASDSSNDDGVGEGRKVPRTDRVEISPEGRVLSALAVDSGRPTEAELHNRIVSGFYDQPEVAEEVARRILEGGDLYE